MKPVQFKEHNTIIAKDQKPYIPLPAHVGDNGQVITCWQPTLRERIAILFGCPLWLSTLTFNQPLQPIKLAARRPFIDPDTTEGGFKGFLRRCGLVLGAVAPEVDDVATLPEYQRAWYTQDPTTKKFKVDLTKVDVEDVTGLRNANVTLRNENKTAKEAQEAAVREAMKKYEGIDPDKARAMLAAFHSEEEKRLIAQGPEGINKVVQARMENARLEYERQCSAANKERDEAYAERDQHRDRVVDNHVRAAAAEAGIVPSAIEDVLLRGRQIFKLDSKANPVQYDEDGKTVILGKDSKTPFSPKEWLEGMKVKAPHWFPASGSGGGAGGGGKGKTQADLSKLSPTERINHARAQQGQG